MKRNWLMTAVAVLSIMGATHANAKGYYGDEGYGRRAARLTVYNPYVVWASGSYVGSDPDENIRTSLVREFANMGS